jgi:hypothetical protein
MEKIPLICPHCGTGQNIDPNKERAFCSFCGSSITEVLKDLKKDEQDKRTQPSPSPSHIPFSGQQSIPSLPRSINLSKKPSPLFQPSHKNSPFQSPVEQTTFPQQQNQQPSAAKLKFPQIHNELRIPYIPAIFHFGRNLIIPLASPDRFDVSWLNSISRVRKQNNMVIHQHFTIMRGNNGKYYIEDNKSRWGTWLNRNQIKNLGKKELKNGDKIELMLSKPDVKQIIPFVILFEC